MKWIKYSNIYGPTFSKTFFKCDNFYTARFSKVSKYNNFYTARFNKVYNNFYTASFSEGKKKYINLYTTNLLKLLGDTIFTQWNLLKVISF